MCNAPSKWAAIRVGGMLDGRQLDRSQYEQQWPLPMSVDRDLPKPWCVAAYSGAALGNVMRSDYGAAYRDGCFIVDGGEMLRVYKSGDLYGMHGGTLSVLYGNGSCTELDRIMDVARERGIRVETLATRA